MWYGSQIAEAIHQYGPEYGFIVEKSHFDFSILRKHREAYIDRSRSSYDRTFNRNGVEQIQGFARFVDRQTVEVNGERIRAKHIVIATGAKPFLQFLIRRILGTRFRRPVLCIGKGDIPASPAKFRTGKACHGNNGGAKHHNPRSSIQLFADFGGNRHNTDADALNE